MPRMAGAGRVAGSLQVRRHPSRMRPDPASADRNAQMTDTVPMPIPVARLNHAVLYVRDATRAAEFYGRVFGFEVVGREFGGQAIFMRAAGGDNHHDLGLFSVGPEAPRPG